MGDQSVSVFLLNSDIVADGAYSYDSSIRMREARVKRVVYNSLNPDPELQGALPDVLLDNHNFGTAMTSLPSPLPSDDPKAFFQAGFVVSSNSIPRRLQGLYRHGIKAIADVINEHPDSMASWLAL